MSNVGKETNGAGVAAPTMEINPHGPFHEITPCASREPIEQTPTHQSLERLLNRSRMMRRNMG